jgi:hypothetical protein
MYEDPLDFLARMRDGNDQQKMKLRDLVGAVEIEQMLLRDRVIAAAAGVVAAERPICPADHHMDELALLQAAQDKLAEVVLAYAEALRA